MNEMVRPPVVSAPFSNGPPPKKQPLVPRDLPKAEMHVHIALAHSAQRFLELGGPADMLMDKSRRYYPDLATHHRLYELLRGITPPDELANVTQKYLEFIARHDGAIYAQISNSYRNARDFEAQAEALGEGIKRAHDSTGIVGRITVTGIRDHGVAHAENAARHLTQMKNSYITCFGLSGDETKGSIADFQRAFLMAWHDAGLGLAPHISEQYLPDMLDFLDFIQTDLREALNPLESDQRRLRIGHATLIHTSGELMRIFADNALCIESCLSANKRIGLPGETLAHRPGDVVLGRARGHSVRLDQPLNRYFNNITAHPIARFLEAGIPVALGSDNPLFHNTSIGKEYSLAVLAGVKPDNVLKFTENAIRYANVDADIRCALMDKIAAYRSRAAMVQSISANQDAARASAFQPVPAAI